MQRHSKALVAKTGFLGSHRSQVHTHGYMLVLRAGSVVDINQLGLVRINHLKQRRVVNVQLLNRVLLHVCNVPCSMIPKCRIMPSAIVTFINAHVPVSLLKSFCQGNGKHDKCVLNMP